MIELHQKVPMIKPLRVSWLAIDILKGHLTERLIDQLGEFTVAIASECQIFNANLVKYKIPTAQNMPDIDSTIVDIVESEEPGDPLGSKEVGERAVKSTISTILNAVHDTIGGKKIRVAVNS